MFVLIGVTIYFGWKYLGFKGVYYSLFKNKRRKLVKREIIEKGLDNLQGDEKISAYLRNPIISNTAPEIITQVEVEIEQEKPINEMKDYIREQLSISEFPDSPLVYESIKLSLMKKGFKESFIKRTIKQIQKETKHGKKQIWGQPSPSGTRDTRNDARASPINAPGSNLGGIAKPGNIPVGTIETLGTTQRLDGSTSSSPQRKSKYFD